MSAAADVDTPLHLIHNALMVASWADSHGQPTVLGCGVPGPSCQPALDVRFDAPACRAFLKLRVAVRVKHRSRRIYLFLYIYPEQLASVEIHSAAVPAMVHNAMLASTTCSSAADIMCLALSLKYPSTLIGPAGLHVEARGNASIDIFKRMQSLTRAVSLRMYFPAQSVLARSDLDAFCALGTSGSLSSNPDERDLSMLYSGHGGEPILVVDNQADSSADPPSYDELALPPATADGQGTEPPRRKRSRDVAEVDSSWMERVESELAQLRSELAAAVEQAPVGTRDVAWFDRIEARVDALQAELHALRRAADERVDDVGRRVLDQLKDRVDGQLDSRLRKLLEEKLDEMLEERLGEILEGRLDERDERLHEDVINQVDLRIEDTLDGYKDDLRDYVQNELKDVSDSLRDSLQNALTSIELE